MILVLGSFAGVFSNFLKLLNWSFHCKEDDKILFYYTNKSNNDDWRVLPFQNYEQDLQRIFFYKYFEYPEGCSSETFLNVNQFEMGYPPSSVLSPRLTIYTDDNLPQIRQVYHEQIKKKLIFTPLMDQYVGPYVSLIKELQQKGKRILAVFIRCTQHFESYDVEKVFEETQSVVNHYDYILPITQVGPFFEKAKALFGDKCISIPRHYLSTNMDWTRPMSDEEFEEEFCSAIRDVYLASQCDFVLGGASNMFLSALFWNPQIPFKIFDELVNKNLG